MRLLRFRVLCIGYRDEASAYGLAVLMSQRGYKRKSACYQYRKNLTWIVFRDLPCHRHEGLRKNLSWCWEQ